MKKTICIMLCALTVLMLLALPFAVPSGSMLYDYQDQWMEWAWDSEALVRLLLPAARAEEAAASLPIDLSPGMEPNPAAYTETSYEDNSITVRIEHIEDEEKNLSWRVAYVQIQDPSQLRTGVAGNNVKAERTSTVSSMAEKYKAVIAINGDYFINDTQKKSFEFRMGQKIRSLPNAYKDILIIDENGDFHIITIDSVPDGKAEVDAAKAVQQAQIDAIKAEHQIINAFTFGPALVKDGELINRDITYDFNRTGDEPRCAIGQMGPLSYVLVLAEGRGGYADGVTQQELANFMYDEIGCLQAYNLDGGNSGTIVLGKTIYKADHATTKLRDLNDCIYFATTVDPASWSK